jgi:hypothetical protein
MACGGKPQIIRAELAEFSAKLAIDDSGLGTTH